MDAIDDKPITWRSFKKWLDALAQRRQADSADLVRVFDGLDARISALQARVAELEKRQTKPETE